jgi:hypothetical protein
MAKLLNIQEYFVEKLCYQVILCDVFVIESVKCVSLLNRNIFRDSAVHQTLFGASFHEVFEICFRVSFRLILIIGYWITIDMINFVQWNSND